MPGMAREVILVRPALLSVLLSSTRASPYGGRGSSVGAPTRFEAERGRERLLEQAL
jgi:hypothetical protein